VLSRSGLVAEVWGSQHLAVLEFVDGVPLAGTVEDQAAIGATLARVHEIAQVPAGDLEKWFGLITGLEAYWDLEPWIRPAIEDAVDGVRAYAASHELTWAGLHADPAADAFIRQPSGEIALIDWGGWMLGPTLYDIASAIMYAGQPEPLVSAYRAKRPDLQTDAIPTFLRFRHAVQASYFAYRITEDIQTGVVPGNENSKGLADARRSLLGAP
jgi:homoserine kinase type II